MKRTACSGSRIAATTDGREESGARLAGSARLAISLLTRLRPCPRRPLTATGRDGGGTDVGHALACPVASGACPGDAVSGDWLLAPILLILRFFAGRNDFARPK